MTSQTNSVLNGADYEVIDQDPHFSRVVKYFRGGDYARIGLFTASGPAFLAAIEYISSGGKQFHVPMKWVRRSAVLGLMAGFLSSYSTSSLRFMGATENAREVNLDRFEIKSRLAAGKSAYRTEESNLPEWVKSVAARNSTNSALNMSILPWFNFVHHDHHGVSLDKYYETRPGEEKWGFTLAKPE